MRCNAFFVLRAGATAIREDWCVILSHQSLGSRFRLQQFRIPSDMLVTLLLGQVEPVKGFVLKQCPFRTFPNGRTNV